MSVDLEPVDRDATIRFLARSRLACIAEQIASGDAAQMMFAA
jgi:hypothetical protein